VKQAYLLSGAPGVGKTSIIQEAIATVKGRAGGFYTREMRSQGARQGFEIITLDGYKAILAHINIHSPYQVSKYGVDIDSLDKVGVEALRRAITGCDIVVIDEIGKMELFSSAFRQAVWEALQSPKKVLGTIMLSSYPWADQIKQHPKVNVIQVSRSNHRQVLAEVVGWLEQGANWGR